MDTNQLLLSPISLAEFTASIKEIVREEIRSHNQESLQAQLLSPAQTCKLFDPSISKVTLHQWTKDGLIPVHRIGGRIFYRHSEVIEAAQRIKKFDRNKQMA